jgi:hypothetical protein
MKPDDVVEFMIQRVLAMEARRCGRKAAARVLG